jgi:hypothetical protein
MSGSCSSPRTRAAWSGTLLRRYQRRWKIGRLAENFGRASRSAIRGFATHDSIHYERRQPTIINGRGSFRPDVLWEKAAVIDTDFLCHQLVQQAREL